MTDTTNITVVRRFYGGLGAPDTVGQLLSPDIRFEIVAGSKRSF
jgi:hypothetical protein